MNKNNVALMAATISDLTDLVLANKYIVSIELKDTKLEVMYSDNSIAFIDIPSSQTTSQSVDLTTLERNLSDLFKNDIESKLEEIKKSIVIPPPVIIKGKRGKRGQEVDQEYITKVLLEQLQGKLEEELLIIKKAIPEPIKGEDGKDADEEAIKTSVLGSIEEQLNLIKENINDELQENLRSLVLAISVPKDGKDADEVKIINQVLDNVNEVIVVSREEIRTTLQDYILEQIKTIQEGFKPETPVNGKDGKDADEQKIITQVLKNVSREVNSELAKSKTLIESEIKHGFALLKDSIPEVKDGVDGRNGQDGKDGKSIKGDKGDKGDAGNGIKNAEVDNRNHLIIETDDRTIDAGKIQVKQVFSGGFGFNYTNELPMPFDVGLLPKGTKFKDTDLKVLFTKLLYGYNFPKFTNFIIVGLLDNVEIGYSIIAGDYQANFTITDPELLRPDSISVLKEGQVLLDNLPNVSPVNVTLAEETKNTIDVITFEIFAYDTTGVSFNKYFTVNCKYRIYYGEYTEDITDTGFPNPLIVLRASELVIDIYGEYFFQNIPLGSNYKWFCYPSILGENYIFYDTVSDIALILNDVLKLNITNEHGLVIEYNCYRTLNEIHEDILMKVKNG